MTGKNKPKAAFEALKQRKLPLQSFKNEKISRFHS